MEFLSRFGLLIAAGIIIFLARRLHTKGRSKTQKNVAAAVVFLGGLALVGTLVGGWMATISAVSPYVAAGLFLLSVGGFVFDIWTDKTADKFAFYCALLMPLAIVFGLAQMSNLGDEVSRSGRRVSSTIEQSGR